MIAKSLKHGKNYYLDFLSSMPLFKNVENSDPLVGTFAMNLMTQTWKHQ